MGKKGIAIDPTDAVVVAPASATVNLVFLTAAGHSDGLTTENAELSYREGYCFSCWWLKTYVKETGAVRSRQNWRTESATYPEANSYH